MSQVQLYARLQESTDYLNLDLHASEPIKLVLSVQNINDPLAATSVFSRTFRVPHTSINGPYFKAVFNVNSIDYDAGVRADAYIMDNGQLFTNGNIILNAIYVNEEDGNVEYEITFLGETSDFGSKIGGGFMNEIDLSQYNHTKDFTNITNSWNNQLFGGDAVYGLIEWGYTYTPSNQPAMPTLSNGFAKSFTNFANPLYLEQWKPQFRAKAIWDQIFKESGYTYDSTFLDSTFFKNMYIISENAANAFLDNANTFSASNEYQVALTNSTTTLRANTEIADPGNNYNPVTSQFKAPVAGSYTFNSKFNVPLIRGGYDLQIPCYLQLRKVNNSSIVFSTGFTIVSNPDPDCYYCVQSNDIDETFTVSLQAGDIVELQLVALPAAPYYSGQSFQIAEYTFKCIDAPQVFSASGIMPSNVRKVDFMRSIINRFKLVFEPSRDIRNHFTITPWKDWILTGTSKDWSDKLDASKDIKIKPLFYGQSRFQVFKDQEDGDYLNYNYQLTYKQTVGQLNLDSTNELITGSKTYQDQFAPTPIAPIGFKDGDIDGSRFLVPHIAKDTGSQQDAGSTVISGKREPVQPKLRLVFYNGLVSAPLVWYMATTAGGGGGTAKFQYPLMSQYSSWPITPSTFDLNWENEAPFWDVTNSLLGDGKCNLTTYNTYWQKWYDMTFDPYSRIVEASMVLDYKDILELKFNDYIFIKDAWYFINNISDYVVGQNSNCKVELIKLGNNIGVTVPTFIPPQPTYNSINLCKGVSACDAYCCNSITVENNLYYMNGETIETSSFLFLDSAGTIYANAGYYSNGTFTFEVDGNGGIIGSFNNALCSCVTQIYEFEVTKSNNPCEACCGTGGATVIVYGINPDFYANTNLYLDYDLSIPATIGYYILSPSTIVSVVIQGGIVNQTYNCLTCNCTSLYSHTVRYHSDLPCEACCSPYTTIWTDNATWVDSTLFYADNAGVQNASDGYYSFEGYTIQVIDGMYENFSLCTSCPACPAKPINILLDLTISTAGYLSQIQLEQSLDNGLSWEMLDVLNIQPGETDLHQTLTSSADLGAILKASYFSNAVGGTMDAKIYADTTLIEAYPTTASPASFSQTFQGPLVDTVTYTFELIVDVPFICDDTLIVGGEMTLYKETGWPGGGTISSIVGLSPNGSINQDFNFVGGLTRGINQARVWDIKKWNNRLVISGEFDHYKGVRVTNGLIVLELDGSVYEPFQTLEGAYGTGGGESPSGRWVEVVGDAAYIGGEFIYWNESPLGSGGTNYYLDSIRMVKINLTNGSIDKTFNAKFDGTDRDIEVIKEHAGYIYVGGFIVGYNGVNADRWLLKLDTTGAKDPSFTTNVGGTVLDMEFDGDYIYVGGQMSTRIQRLHLATGLVDETWTHSTFDETVEAINIVGDTIYCVGYFITYGATAANRIIAIDKLTGSAAPSTFNIGTGTGFNDAARNAIVYGDWLYVAGDFTEYNGNQAGHIAKISLADGTLDPTFITGTGFSALTIGLFLNSCYVPPPVSCNLQTLNYSPSSPCDTLSGTGTSVSASYWVNAPTLGSATQLLTCNDCDTIPVPPVDCVMSAWSDWSTCANGQQTRTRSVITPASGGGTPCGDLTETQACSITYRCVDYTIATTSLVDTTTTYIDCVGFEQSITLGGSNLDSVTFCAYENTLVLGPNTTYNNNGLCGTVIRCNDYQVQNNNAFNVSVSWFDCDGVGHTEVLAANRSAQYLCVQNNRISTTNPGGTVITLIGACNSTPPTCVQWLGISTNQLGGYVDFINCNGVETRITIPYNPAHPERQQAFCALAIGTTSGNIALANNGQCP